MRQKLRQLSTNLAIYGVGDVAIQVVNFLLLSVYVRYLSPTDYGVLALLGSVEAVTKLRDEFRKSGVEYRVVKNTLVRHAVMEHPWANTLAKSLTGE